MSMSFSSTRTIRRAFSVASIAAVMVLSAAGTADAKGPPQLSPSGTSAGSGTVIFGAGCFVKLAEDGTFTRTFVAGNVTFVLSSPYDANICVEQSDAGGFTDSGTFTLSTPEGTLMASISGTETAGAFSLTLTATGGTGLYQGVAGTIAWSGIRTGFGETGFTTTGVWTPNLNRPVL
jgi:hypothetical protein